MSSYLITKLFIFIVLALAGNLKNNNANLKVEFTKGRTDFIFGDYMLPPSKIINTLAFLLIRASAGLAAPQNIFKSTLCDPKLFPQTNYFWLFLLLALSGDVEVNPGPTKHTKFPCGVCNTACKWGQRAIACDNCGVWYHTTCACLSKHHYNLLANCSLSWCCLQCGMPNFTSSFFESLLPTHKNSFESLEEISLEHETSVFHPNYTSTPIKKSKSCNKSLNSPNKPVNSPHKPGLNPPSKNKTQCSNSILNCLVINFQSLFSKKEELRYLIDSYKIDIIIGTETWLGFDILDSELPLEEFDIFRHDRTGRGGGTLLAIKKHLNGELVFKSNNTESLFCKIKVKNNKPIIIGSVYRPPNANLELSKIISNEINNINKCNKNSIFWIGGDFNLPDVDWKKEEIVGHQYPKALNEIYLEMAGDLSLKQIVKEPTRGKSFLDLFFTSNPNLINNSSVIAGLGDHEAVLIKTKINIPPKKPIKHKIQLWKRVNEQKLKEDCEEVKNQFLEKFTIKDNVDDIWKYIKAKLLHLMKENVPTKTASTKRHQPWINTETKRLIRKKQRWFTKAKKCNSNKVWRKYRETKKECQRACRKAHNNYLNDILTEDVSNKKLWRYIKSKNQENCGISDLKDKTGNIIQDSIKKSNILNEQFASVFSNPKSEIKHNFPDSLPKMNDIKVSKAGVLKLLKNIKPNKATGPDGIPGKLLKICSHQLAEVFQLLFQASLDQGLVPKDWKKANVVPLYKKGNKNLAENYRPISLTSISCKLLEHIIHSNIMDHFDKFEVLNNSQHGFRQKRSCETQLINTINEFSNCLNNKGQIDAILLDFSKAFDKVDHKGLLLKLKNLGIRGPLSHWISSFLIGREQTVLVDGKCSDPTPVLSGVPQGTVLGPLFFLVYINDISSDLSKGTFIRLFADDSLLFREIKSQQDCKILQEDLNKLQKWEEKWKMEFHPDKCQLIQISNKTKTLISSDYYIHNQKLEVTDSAKYLGVIIDNKLNWKNQCISVCKKANKMLAFLKRNINNCPLHIKNHCFKALVRPTLEYGSVIWDPYYMQEKDRLEKINKRAARFVTGNYVLQSGNNKENMQNLGWEPLEERRARIKVQTIFKARQNLIDIPMDHLTINTRKKRNFNGLTYTLPMSNVDSHLYSFYPSSIRLWNRLPADAQECEDVDTFTTKLKKITLRSNYATELI